MNLLIPYTADTMAQIKVSSLARCFLLGFALLLLLIFALLIAWDAQSFTQTLSLSQIHSIEGNTESSIFFLRSSHRLGRSPRPRPNPIGLSDEAKPRRQDDGKFYGGIGDASHLGGWTDFDSQGVSNMTWDYMIGILGVKSLLDIGCGRGYSTKYFYDRGVRVLCIEGSRAAIKRSHLPVHEHSDLIVEHDYSLGAYWPDKTFDACWSVEFVEHVSRQYFRNYINSFRQCALIFVTASRNGGYHHVSNV